MNDKPKKLSEIDDFWNLDNLMPQKKPTVHRAVNTETVEIEFTASESGRTGSDPVSAPSAIPPRKDPPPESAAPSGLQSRREPDFRTRAQAMAPKCLEPYLVYRPAGGILKQVSVSKWQTRYNFYEKFHADAQRLWNRTASAADPVPFFSYIPQYNQLRYDQLKWYLFWREKARRGEYLRADYSYILLYIYEIINCPELLDPAEGVRQLCGIWLAYRSFYPRIDSYLCEWLCDYCLIHQLPCPTEQLEPISQAIVAAASFKEFYMDSGRPSENASHILSYSSGYDWRSSRYVDNSNIRLFAHHIRAAFDKVYRERLSGEGAGIAAAPTQIVRDAYNGALCVRDQKRCLTVQYISYTRSPKFRFLVTDCIKYCENRVRMALGIKARLKTDNLTPEIKACIDEYFDANLPAKKTASRAAEPAEYEKLYEPTHTGFSMERAIDIEKQSWSTTEILTAAFSDGQASEINPPPAAEPDPIPVAAPQPQPDVPAVSDGDEFAGLIAALDPTAVEALKALAGGDPSGLAKAAASAGILTDALADTINSAAFDHIGDTVIEPDGSGYRIIPDYEGDLAKWLK